jgi:hypothetical protein
MAFAGALCAQVPVVRSGTTEIGGFAGATYGIGNYGIMGGGNVSYAVTKWLLPYVEYSYFPSISREATGNIAIAQQSGPTINVPYTVPYTMSATDIHGGVHLRLRIKESRFVPYGVFGIGRMGFSGSSALTAYYTEPGITKQQSQSIGTPPGGGRLAINFGGGVRFYVNPRYGFRIEVKGYKPTSQASEVAFGYPNPFLKAEGGFFFQFK